MLYGVIRRAKCLYDQLRVRPNFQKDLEDKKKGNMEYRNNGNNPPFIINNSHRKLDPNEPRMTKTLGKGKGSI
jgi:hypothetical protein